METGHKRLENSTKDFQKHFENSSDGDDVYKCFMNILSRLNDTMKITMSISSNMSKDPDTLFNQYRHLYTKFIFDLFYGQMENSIKCKNCHCKLSQNYQLIKGIPLILKEEKSTSLETCVQTFLGESQIVVYEDWGYTCCDNQCLVSQTSITHAPKYLCLYLNRGSFFTNGPKNNVLVTSNFYFKLSTTNGDVHYTLQSVIDHIGTNESGHYITKSIRDHNSWWLFNDNKVVKVRNPAAQIVTRNTNMFMFKQNK